MGRRESGNSDSGDRTLQFRNRINDEEISCCKMLLKDRYYVELCNQKTWKEEFHYCSDCWSIIATEHGRASTKIWPPKRENFNSRYCFDIQRQNVFLVPEHWMTSYTEIPTISDGSAIEVQYRKHHSKKGGNYPCWVYAIRLMDGMIYIGQTKTIDAKSRIHRHKNNPGKTVKKFGGYKSKILEPVKVNNRATAEALEQYLVDLLRAAGSRATKGYEQDD